MGSSTSSVDETDSQMSPQLSVAFANGLQVEQKIDIVLFPPRAHGRQKALAMHDTSS